MKSSGPKKKAQEPQTPQASPRRIQLFRLIALILPVLFFGLLEGGLRLANYGENLDLFIPTPRGFADKEYLMVNPNVAKRYFTKGAYTPTPPYEFLLKNKPANGYRIIVMGESTTAGWPYPNNVLFSRILNQRLSDAFPDKYVEITNVAIAAINSYTLLDFMDEVLAQKPDAILIYEGHNEFYGALGVASTESLGKYRPLVLFFMSLQKLKTIELLETSIAQARRWFSGVMHIKTLEDKYGTLMGRMIGETNVPYKSPDYELAKRDFQANLRSIFEKAKSAGVPIVISELVSNIRDLPPFVSSKSDPALSADAVYREAQSLEAEGKYASAHTAYYRAKDLDELRFRASEEFNEVIQEVAAEFNAPVVPMKSYFEAASPHGLIGYNLMLEHLHPNVDGQFIMSQAFFDTLHQHGMIAPQWNEALIKPATYYREHWPVTELDSTLGMLRILNLTDHWPFKPLDKPGHAFRDFRPSDQEQELAYRVVKEEINYTDGHLAAAQMHESRGQYEAALREYQALVAAAPTDYQTLLIIARQLIDTKQLDQAMTYLMASLRIKDTAYANKWIGQINLYHRKPQLARLFLEKAVSIEPMDPQSLYNLSGAYLLSGEWDKAQQTASRLEKIQADYPGLAELKTQLKQRQNSSATQ